MDRDGQRGSSREPGSVSSGTLGDAGEPEVEVRAVDDLKVLPEAVRAVVVAFTVSPGRVVFSDRVTERIIGTPSGEYALLFEIGNLSRKEGEETEWCHPILMPGHATTDARSL